MPFFSIVVPVYKTEDFIDECVNSVLTQTFDDFELILVDDGSPDRCPQICDDYSNSDSRVHVIHKQNGGLSSARNAGMTVMNGLYLLFLDSDDFWNDQNMLKILYNKISETGDEIVLFGCTDFNMITGNKIISRSAYDLRLISENNYSKTLHYLLSSKMIPGGSTIFTISTSVLKNVDFFFKEGIQDEDYDYVLTSFINAKSITAIDNPFYMYRQGRDNSITGVSSIKMIEGIEYTLNKWLPLAKQIDDSVLQRDVLNYLAFIYTTGFVVLGRLPKQDGKRALDIMRRNKSILKYGYWRKTKIIRFADALLGDRVFSKLSVIYYRHTHIGV